MANTTTPPKYKSKAVKFTGVILLILFLLLGSYIAATVAAKNSIRQNLTSKISDLMQSSGAERIRVDIYAEPDGYSLPTDLHFHVFLKLEYNSLSSVSKDTMKKILTNNGKSHSTEYSYDWDALDYAAYTHTTSDSVFGNLHPVFLTLTDGDSSYMLKRESYSKVSVGSGDTYSRLTPPAIHPIILVVGFLAAVFFLLYLAALNRQSKKRKALAEEQRQQLAIARANDRSFGLQYILDTIEEELAMEEAEESKASGKKKLKILLIVAACAVLAAVLLVTLYFIPNSRYNEAMALKNAGKDKEAYTIFQSLGIFRDSRDICNSYDYDAAVRLFKTGKYGPAYYKLRSISGHAPAEQKAAELLTAYPHLSILDAKVGTEITLGSYEQDNNTANGAEPVQWVVLKNSNGILFAVSKHILDAKPYNTANARGSTLLPWLRDDFHDKVFGDLGAGFVSKVGLLTRDEITTYDRHFDRTPEWTAYAKAQDPEKHSFSGYSWWLEGDYFSSGDMLMSVVIESGGYSNYSSDITSVNGVRPTIIIDCTGTEKDYYAEAAKDDTSSGADVPQATGVASTSKNTSSTNKNTSSVGKTKCSRCNGTGKVVLHYGNSWNQKEGYRYGEKCGACGGTGYK